MDTSSQTLDLLRALAGALAVLVPLVVFWFQRRDRLQKSKYLIDLVRSYEELVEIRKRQVESDAPPIVLEKIDTMIGELDRELKGGPDKLNITPFMVVLAVVTFFVSLLFTQLSDYINRLFTGKSYESELFFLEGIFASAMARFALLLVYLVISIFLTILVSRLLVTRMKNALVRNLLVLLVFFGVFACVSFLLSLILVLLDPVTTLW
jgi:hypothetical protein